MADTKEFGEGLRVEVGLRQDIILLYTDFEEGHQLTVVLQVGIALTLDVLRQYLTGYLRTAAQFYVFLQPLGEVEITLHEAYNLVFQLVYLMAQSLIVGLHLFDLFLCHKQS